MSDATSIPRQPRSAESADDSSLGPAELGLLAWSLARRRALQRAGIHEFELDLGPDPGDQGELIHQLLAGSGPEGAAIHPDDREQVRAALLVAVASGLDLDQTYRVRQADGAICWLRATASAAEPGTGRIFGVLQDVTQVRQREDALEHALQEKDLLLREVDHRVKNSLQLTASLIALQAGATGDEEMRAAFNAIRGRVQAIASVHASLYREEAPGEVDARTFLTSLVHDLARAAPSHSIQIDSDEAKLPAGEAASLAIALNELLSSVFQHAYPDGRGPVRVSFRIDETRKFRLEVADQRNHAGQGADDAVGMRILGVLAQRWRGDIHVQEGQHGKVSVLTGRI
ncbi:MAG: signal transduction histidine kinase [Rhodospirillales bacterium]|nr:signal transduction histidine kinase [Rhodospirillales bacterium]